MHTQPTKDPDLLQLLDWATTLRRYVGWLERQLRQQASEPFSATEFSMLETIKSYGPIAVGELADREQMSPPTASKVIVVLEKAGVIERLTDPSDRRISRVQLSAQGIDWMEKGREQRYAWLASRIAGLPDAQRDALVAALPALEAVIDHSDG